MTFIVDMSCQGTPDILEEVKFFIVVFVCLCVLIVSTVTVCFIVHITTCFKLKTLHFSIRCIFTLFVILKKWIISLNSTNGFVFVAGVFSVRYGLTWVTFLG